MWALPRTKEYWYMRQTAATRVVEMDFEVPAKIADLNATSEEFYEANTARLNAQKAYDDAKRALDHERQGLAEAVTSTCYSSNPKVTQAEIDRKLKSELHNNPVYRDLDEQAFLAKYELDRATSEYEAARIQHRTIVSQLNASSAALNFMSSSKTARAIALQNLSDL